MTGLNLTERLRFVTPLFVPPFASVAVDGGTT
jgi:hypothetical protein